MAAQLESTARFAATDEADLSRPLLDVHAGLTSGHASVTSNCEADDEQSRCRLFAPTQVPAATRAAPQRPSIPQAQAVQTPAVADEVLGGRWTPTPVRPRNRRSATTSARSGSTPTAGRRSPRKRSGPAPARSAITSHSTPGATGPVHRSGPSGGARADARGTSAASTIVRADRGRSRRRQRTRDRPRRIVAGPGPGVAEVAVVGVPDPMMGEKVGAVVVPHPGTPWSRTSWSPSRPSTSPTSRYRSTWSYGPSHCRRTPAARCSRHCCASRSSGEGRSAERRRSSGTYSGGTEASGSGAGLARAAVTWLLSADATGCG